jgi:hypothetical protein
MLTRPIWTAITGAGSKSCADFEALVARVSWVERASMQGSESGAAVSIAQFGCMGAGSERDARLPAITERNAVLPIAATIGERS